METLISEIVNLIIKEFNKDSNRILLESKIIDPILNYIFNKLRPYVIMAVSFFMIIILLVITTLCLILFE